ncbi:M20/M25/M40 family metallo-hydrolase [Candidatus Poribacteria bacterium]|nr:M20/M25/M40 family metallo-hydrolase [Candidatus Poribacteria bacterium]
MPDKTLEMLKEITEAPGVSGYEREVREVIRKYMEDVTEIDQDNLGSIICKKAGISQSPKIMMAGHMDEIGFMVKFITDEGFIKFSPLGGWWAQVILSQRVIIKTSKGDILGVVGSKPPHILSNEERGKMVKRQDMFIDVGAANADEAKEFGIRPGDPIIPVSPFEVLKNEKMYLAKAWDDRIGCALFMDSIRQLVNEEHPNTVYGVGTVQEEVGLRGARTSAWAVQPDVGIALEVSIAGDVPGVKKEESQDTLGKGPSILVYDSSMIPNLKLRDMFIDTAKEENISIQMSVMERGGTDAGAIHVNMKGVPSIVIGVPCRYIHSHVGIINRDDYDNTVKLLVAVIKRLDAETVADLKV